MERASLLSRPTSDETPAPKADVSTLQELLNGLDDNSTAFQSVAVAAVQILERALCFEREAAAAALSLGQQQKMKAMVDTAASAVQVLRNALEQQGARVMHLCACPPEQATTGEKSWWPALNDALRVLEEGTGRMASLTTAQPQGSPARALSRVIAQLLRNHHDALVLEADQWMA